MQMPKEMPRFNLNNAEISASSKTLHPKAPSKRFRAQGSINFVIPVLEFTQGERKFRSGISMIGVRSTSQIYQNGDYLTPERKEN
jgi:hypothetical protein